MDQILKTFFISIFNLELAITATSRTNPTVAEVKYINATFKCCGFSEKQLCNAGRIEFLPRSNTVQMSPLLSLIRFLLRNDTHMLSLCESCPCSLQSWAHESLQSNFSSGNPLVSHNTLVFCAICDVTGL